MNTNLPLIIKDYIDASNAHDVRSILTCFADDTMVLDETQTIAAGPRSNGGLEQQSRNISFNSDRSAPKRAAMKRSSLWKFQELFQEVRFLSTIASA